MSTWDIAVGETLVRRDLHLRWGGAWYGGMEPAPKAKSVFLFTEPQAGKSYGYQYDGFDSDGTFHYTGDGQVGDQDPASGGNRSLLATVDNGRAVRLFRSESPNTTYLGRFVLADPPYYTATARDREGALRTVLVFRLAPTADSDTSILEPRGGDGTATAAEIPLERLTVESYLAIRASATVRATRREAELVLAYADWLTTFGHLTVRQLVRLPDGGSLYTDAYDKTTGQLVEAKGSSGRKSVRQALGQILDYGRFVEHASLAILTPDRPAEDLVSLLRSQAIAAIWRTPTGFERSL